MAKTIGQVEAELTKAIVRFEKEYLGRGPRWPFGQQGNKKPSPTK